MWCLLWGCSQIPAKKFQELKKQVQRPELAELEGRGVVVHGVPPQMGEGDLQKHFSDLSPEEVQVVDVCRSAVA